VVVPLQQVTSSSTKEIFKETLSPKLQPRGNTDFKVALETAFGQLQDAGIEGARPVVVFLTDGEPDPNPRRSRDAAFMTSYMESLWDVVGHFALEGYPIYTVGFSSEIDPEVISRISLDTKGEYYILNEPGELLVSFFELLGNLKNRKGLLEDTYSLQTGAPRTFEFWVDEYTRQVNLVAVNLSAGDCEMSLVPLQGDTGPVEGLTVNKQQNYSMIILHQPGEAYRGKWQATVSGRGSVRVLGDMDLFIKAWLEEPAPSSQHPLNEPFRFKVKVTGGEHLQDTSLKAEVQLKKSGLEQPVVVPLTAEGGYFTGSYEPVDKTGTYELLLRLLLEDEVVNTSFSKVYVKMLPVLTTDFWAEEGYRMGEELVVTASLNLGGKRLLEGRELKVENFNLILTYENGTKVTLPLYDNGNQQYGDIKAADGIWSNRFTFERQGIAKAYLLAVGEYTGRDFFLEKNIGDIAVYPPGTVQINLPRQSYWSLAGKSLSFPVNIKNESAFKETLVMEQLQSLGSFLQSRLVLEPGEEKAINLDVNLHRSLNKGKYSLPVVFNAENDLTTVIPSRLEIAIEIVTPGKAFLRNFAELISSVFLIALIIILAGIFIYAGGLLLYRFLVLPQKKVGGYLLYWRTGSSDTEEALPQKLKLGNFNKEIVTVSLDPGNEKADFILKGSEFVYDIIIRTVLEDPYPFFIQGWKALIKRNLPVKTFLQCTQPGIFEFEGGVYTRKELFDSDKFESGEFGFQYINPKASRLQDNIEGVNILEGKS